MKKRSYRKEESHEAERATRDIVVKFLFTNGFKDLRDERDRQGQTISGIAPGGNSVSMRVKLCWRREKPDGEVSYLGTQLISKIKNNDWEASLRRKVDSERSYGVTHFLFVQRDNEHRIVRAAFMPLEELLHIWTAQKNAYDRLIRQGGLGRRKKNPAQNGSSPTLHLKDKNAPEAERILWTHPNVQKLENNVSPWLQDDEAEQHAGSDSIDYCPQGNDRRQVVERQIRERRGQQQFRECLCKRYGNCCLVTGSRVLAVLEAAHINPYRGTEDNHPANGLLLRTDVHTLFDLDLLGIEPNQLRVELHPDIARDTEYSNLDGKILECEPDSRPSQEALKRRYEQFRQQVHT